jgi:dipeptidyl aminopeptidase/acylaminoacyl peptidase
MKFPFVLLLGAFGAQAQDWSLERLFSRPYVWGTAPSQFSWPRQGHTLVFLWNAEGRRFLDLYAYHPDTAKLVRLTNLEGVKDDINRTEEEKDEIRRLYLAPASGLSSYSLADDGSRVAFSWNGDIYLVATGGSEPPFRLTKTRGAESLPRLSPEGKRLAYMRGGQLFVQDLTTGQLTQVTDIEGATLTGYRWSRNGERFVYSVRKGSRRQMPLTNYSGRLVASPQFARDVAGDDPAETSYFVIASDGGKPKALESGTLGSRLYASLPEWSPDSRKLLFRAVHPRMKKQQIVVIDAETGKAKVIVEETDEKWVYWSTAVWAPDSKTVLFNSERGGWAHLYTVPAEGGEARQLTKGDWEVNPDIVETDPQWIGDHIYFNSTEGSTAERHFYRMRADGSAKEKLSHREGLNFGYVSEDGRHTAWMLADLNHPLDLYVGTKRVTQSPQPEFFKYNWPETRLVSFPSRRDRKMVAAKLLLPAGYRPETRGGKLWPAVFFIHGAGYATSVLKQWGSYNETRFAFNTWLAHNGYVVMDLDYRGSSGYGRAWRSDVYLHLGGPDLEDVLGAIDYLRGLGNVDMSKIGIWGASYGGFMTNMAMFLSPDTFRAGSSWAAVNDWENYNAFYTTQRLNTPRENPEAYRRSSPIYFSRYLKNPLLIVHGMVDNNVLFQDAVQLTEKLIHEGKPFEQIYYPQESHAFVREETWIDAFRRTADLFARYLK